jgi:cytochrome P450
MAVASNNVDFALGGDVEDLHGVLRRLRESSPVAPVRYFGEPAWLLTSYDAVEAAYRDDELFPAAAAFKEFTEPALGRNLQCMQGDEHKRNRMLVSPSFRARSIETLVQPVIDETAHALVDGFGSSGEVELVEQFNRHFPGTVICRLLGIPRTRDVDLQNWAHQLLSFQNDPAGALAAKDEITRFLTPLVHERRREPADDLISILATTEVDGEQLTDEEILSFVRHAFAAGTDTTFFGVANTMFALLTHPDQLERVLADPDTEVRWAVEEALRWESPVAMEPRTAPRAVRWFGADLPERARLLFAITAANRDPSRFDDPDVFDVGRRPSPIMTFGIGAHFCLGAHLARAELITATRVLLDRLRDLRLADPDTRIAGTVLRGPKELRVRFTPG